MFHATVFAAAGAHANQPPLPLHARKRHGLARDVAERHFRQRTRRRDRDAERRLLRRPRDEENHVEHQQRQQAGEQDGQQLAAAGRGGIDELGIDDVGQGMHRQRERLVLRGMGRAVLMHWRCRVSIR